MDRSVFYSSCYQYISEWGIQEGGRGTREGRGTKAMLCMVNSWLRQHWKSWGRYLGAAPGPLFLEGWSSKYGLSKAVWLHIVFSSQVAISIFINSEGTSLNVCSISILSYACVDRHSSTRRMVL